MELHTSVQLLVHGNVYFIFGKALKTTFHPLVPALTFHVAETIHRSKVKEEIGG